MSNCSSGCPTQDHQSYGQCLKAKSLRVAYCQSVKGHDYTRQQKWDKNLDHYRRLVDQGIQPDNTWPAACERAERISQEAGEAYVSQI